MRPDVIDIDDRLSIEENELDFRFVRSRGPGGQHVNKASTAVQLRFDVIGSKSLPARVKKRLLQTAKSYATADGEIVIFADRHRSQRRNKLEAVERLVGLIRNAAAPVRRRRKTRPTKASVERRLERKKRRGRLKEERGWRP